jgi:O-antigen/teichoic acid export membrane protein
VSGATSSVGRNAVFYGAAVLASRAVSLVMLPLYTRALTPADYGVLQLLLLTMEVVALLVSAGAAAGVMRFYYRATTDDERHAVQWTALALLAGLNALGAVFVLAAAGPVALVTLKNATWAPELRLAALTFALEPFVAIPMLSLQVRQRARDAMVASLVKLALQVTLNVTLLVVLHMGVRGAVLSACLTNLIMGAVLTWRLRRDVPFRVSWSAARDLRRFGLPYQFVTVGTFILTFGDRFFLQAARGATEVGLYALAYQFGFIVYTFCASPWLQAWTPRRHELVRQPPAERDAAYNEGALLLTVLIVTGVVGAALFAKPALRIIAAPAYLGAAVYVPWIVSAYVLQAWSETAQFGIDVSERTVWATAATWVGTLVVLPAYALMIPRWGATGAAAATIIAFAARALAMYAFAQRLWPVAYRVAPHARALVVGVSVMVAALWMRPDGFLAEVGVGAAALGVYAALSWGVVLDAPARAWVAGTAAGAWKRLRPAAV